MEGEFVEIKGSVFKKFEKNNLFQMSNSDIKERFTNYVLLLIVCLRNMEQFSWNPGEGHRTDKCGHCLAFTKQARKNMETHLRKLLWDQALLQSDQLVSKPASDLALARRPAPALVAPLRHPVSASASTAAPLHHSEEGMTSMAQQPASPPKKQWEKRKHPDSKKPSGHKKARRDKSEKPAQKAKKPEHDKPGVPLRRYPRSRLSSRDPGHYHVDSDESKADSTSPDIAVTSQGPGSPEEPHISFAELMSRFVQLLEIKAQQQPSPSTNKFYDVVRGEQSATITLPLITTLRQAMVQPWDMLANPQPTSRRYEAMYQVREQDIPFLLRYLKPNSVVVESS
ncbi:hypothetical protein EYD10_05825 [Varanus komodoensis]|nr:hypothetical protein EYD10_05825 [Varanus komodoensis]